MALKCGGASTMDGVYTGIDTSQIMATSKMVICYIYTWRNDHAIFWVIICHLTS